MFLCKIVICVEYFILKWSDEIVFWLKRWELIISINFFGFFMFFIYGCKVMFNVLNVIYFDIFVLV